MRKKQKLIIFSLSVFIISFLFFVLILPVCFALDLELQRPFGSLTKSMTISGTSIGDYIQAVYTFAAAVIVGLAVVMVVVSGIEWILAGGVPDKINKAKDRMFKAFMGLFLALFAVFILRTISPGTVTFKSLIIAEIKPTICCTQSDGTKAYVDTEDACTSGGGTVTPGKCGGLPPSAPPPSCTAVDTFATCKAACDPATEDEITGTDLCTAAAVAGAASSGEKCCKIKSPSHLNKCDATTACPDPADTYCALSSSSDTEGECYPKATNGASCGAQWILQGAGTSSARAVQNANGTCLSGVCIPDWGDSPSGTDYYNGLFADFNCTAIDCESDVAVPVRKCVPPKGSGIDGSYCTDLAQCSSGHCYKSTDGYVEAGTCMGKLNSNEICQDANLRAGSGPWPPHGDPDSPCATGSCPDVPGVTDKCP
ncbi:pilin [Patescibacteria group bacterium]